MRKASVLIFCAIILASLLSVASREADGEEAPKPGAPPPLTALFDELSSYFRPVTGKIVGVDGTLVRIETDPGPSARTGMRFTAFKEGVSFTHPVTREPIGKVEAPVGTVEVTVGEGQPVTGTILTGSAENLMGAKVRVTATRIKVLFSQGATPWHLGDAYFQMLKESGRFDLIEAGEQTGDLSKLAVLAKEKGADVALALQSEELKGQTDLTQRLYWAKDSNPFSEKKVSLDSALIRQIKQQRGGFARSEGEILFSYTLPFRARMIAAGDIEGIGASHIILAAGNTVRVYKTTVDLFPLGEFKLPSGGDIIWIGTAQLEKDGREVILATSLEGQKLTSYAYSFTGSGFIMISKLDDTFLRVTEKGIVGQEHFHKRGYDGPVFFVEYREGALKKGTPVPLPPGINIYDFQSLTSPDGREALLVWEENGQLSLYNRQGVRIWMSPESYGGVNQSFSRDPQPAPGEEAIAKVVVDRGKWTLKDRMVFLDGEVLVPRRIPILGVAKGLGYKSSEIRGLLYNGISVEDRPFIQDINGELLDYTVAGDKVFVMTRPIMGVETKKILKGENPFILSLSVYSTRGR